MYGTESTYRYNRLAVPELDEAELLTTSQRQIRSAFVTFFSDDSLIYRIAN